MDCDTCHNFFLIDAFPTKEVNENEENNTLKGIGLTIVCVLVAATAIRITWRSAKRGRPLQLTSSCLFGLRGGL